MNSSFILFLMVSASLFGGITSPLACGLFLALNGLGLALFAPQSRLSPLVFLILPAFFFGLLSSFQKFLKPPFGLDVTQFQVSLESLVLLLAGWAWFAWTSTQPLGSQKRLFLFRTYGWFVAAVGILALIGLFIAAIPCLGALNWLNIPFAVVGAIVSAIALGKAEPGRKGMAMTGLVLCAIAIVAGGFRLSLGGGIL